MSFNRQFFRHIGKILSAERSRRVLYAFVNIIFVALGALVGWGVVKSWELMSSQTFIAGLLLLIVCIAAALYSFINGIIGQLILLISNFIAIFNPEESKYTICAVIVALLSLVGMAVTVIVMIR